MRSFRKASLCDETFTAEQSSDSLPNSDNMTLCHTNPCKHESPFSGITGLVRRSFPRPIGRSSRQGFRGIDENNSSSFRRSMYDEHVIDEVKKVAEHPSSASIHAVHGNIEAPLESNRGDIVVPVVSNLANRSFPRVFARCSSRSLNTASNRTLCASTSSILEVNTLNEEPSCEIDPAAFMKDDMATELSKLEDLLKSSTMSPTKLLSRNFPLTSTHGSSLGSMSSDLSSKNLFDDQSSSNYDNDNFNVNESNTVNDHMNSSKEFQDDVAKELLVVPIIKSRTVETSFADSPHKLPEKYVSNPDNQEKDVRSLPAISLADRTADCTCEEMSNQQGLPQRKIKFLTKLMRRRHLDVKK